MGRAGGKCESTQTVTIARLGTSWHSMAQASHGMGGMLCVSFSNTTNRYGFRLRTKGTSRPIAAVPSNMISVPGSGTTLTLP